ncbi:hypothetical protein BJY00DRAFT_274684 [Aspergillus carlsbadensis]|nr:hypothetical protein BJY00DRAFT_274684 [Aspergillus carlsbadensis]
MVMNWNPEADAKLFQGVLNLLRDSKIKLDCEYLAGFMGPDCLPGAVQNRIVRLKRMAEKGASNEDSTSASGENADEKAAGAGSEDQAQASPAKRKSGRTKGAKGSPAKKVKGNAKVKAKVEEDEDDEMHVEGEGEIEGGGVA